MQQQQKHELVREPQKKIQKNWIRHRFWKRNQNRNTSDNSDYEIEEIEEQEQNINEKNKQQNEIKNKKGKKRTIKLLDYLNNSSQDAKKNRQSSSAWKDPSPFDSISGSSSIDRTASDSSNATQK